MAVDAYIHHHLPGRLRLRIPAAKGEAGELQEISSAIARTPGINQVEYNPVTGSILIRYSREHYKNLTALESGLGGSAAPIALKLLEDSKKDEYACAFLDSPVNDLSHYRKLTNTTFIKFLYRIF